MLLRIIDKPGAEGRGDEIELSLRTAAGTESVTTGPDAALVPLDFIDALNGYFAESSQVAAHPDAVRDLAAKIADIGRRIGDGLVGDDGPVAKLVEAINAQASPSLAVRVESARATFLAAPWELFVLPGCDRALSTMARDFVRRFRGEGFSEEDAELVYDLGVTPPVADAVAALQREMGGETPAASHRDAPLRVLHIVSRELEELLPFASSNALEWATDSFCSEGAVEHEILATVSWEQFEARLGDRERPVHVVHYDGPFVLDGGEASVLLGGLGLSSARITVAKLSRALKQNKVAALGVDARGCFDGARPVDAALGLNAVARAARDAGIGNVIGMAHVTDPWTSGQCFQLVYRSIATGLALGEAVVKARELLRAGAEVSRFASQGLPLHAWPLLVHYGGQSATFFEAPQARVSLEESQTLVRTRQRLLGFNSALLPPSVAHAGDGQAITAIGAIAQSRRALALTGEPGAGKTHVAHRVALYLAQRKLIDFAFYFDFGAESYSTDDVLEMIGPVLGLAPEKKDDTKAALEKLRCCFVLDGFAEATITETEPSPEVRRDLVDLVRELLTDGHIVLSTGHSPPSAISPTFVEIPLRPLAQADMRMLAANQLRLHELAGRDNDAGWEALLAATRGNPFLVTRAVPLLGALSTEGVVEGIGAHVRRGSSPVDSFYEWQWAEMPAPWRRLLLMCAKVEGLLLEMLMVIFDQKTPFAPAKKLTALMGDESTEFRQALLLWERCGFIERLPHGRRIDSRCRPFLERKRQSQSPTVKDSDAQLPFSQTLCEGVRLLSGHLKTKPNPTLAHYLLVNRRQWATHLETLWFAGDHHGFFRTKQALDEFLHQAKLGDETAVWSLSLLQRSPEPDVRAETPPETALAWLALALQALTVAGADANETLAKGAEVWQRWFDALPPAVEAHQVRQLQQATRFLDWFYRTRRDWTASMAVNEKAQQRFVAIKAWPAAIQAFKALARCHVALGQPETALSVEEQILNAIPYENAPPGFHAEQLFDVAVARAARRAFSHARVVLDQLSSMDDGRLGDKVEGLKADILYQQASYADSLHHYCKLWTHAVQAQQQPYIERLRTRLHEIRSKMGSEEFDRRIDGELGDGILRP